MKNGKPAAGTGRPTGTGTDRTVRATDRVRHSPKDLFRMNAEGKLNDAAIRKGISLSALLEEMDPSDEYARDDNPAGLDAFGRIMRHGIGVRTVSSPVVGVWADKMEKMFQPENRGFLLEWVRRRWAEARFGQPANPNAVVGKSTYTMGEGPTAVSRTVWTSADEGALGSIWRPYFDMAGERASLISPAVPLSLLIANTTTVDSRSVRMAYMQDPDATELRMYRVGETAEIPLAKYIVAAHEVRLYKYGRGIEVSYESMREERMDRIAFWIQRQAIQNENDKVAQAIDTLINGDGNANGATSHNKTAMQTGAGGDPLTLRGWLTFLAQFYPNYAPTLAFGRLTDYVDILTLTAPNQNPPAAATGWVGNIAQVRPLAQQTINLGRMEDIPANTVMALDPRMALEHLIQLGANITESDKFITRQTQVVVMSEIEGFDVMDKLATRLLVTNA